MQTRKRQTNLIQDLIKLISYLSVRRRYQLLTVLILMIVSSFSEVFSVGAILPFLAALNNANYLLKEPHYRLILSSLNIRVASQLVIVLSVIFIIATIVSSIIRILTINIQTHLAANISSDLSCQLYKKVLSQPYEFHLQRNSSDLINCITEDTRQLTNFILIPLVAGISTLLVSLFLVVGLFFVSSVAAFFMFFVIGGLFVLLYLVRRNVLSRNSKILVRSSQEQIKVVQESLGGIKDVLLKGTQPFFQFEFENTDKPYRHALASNTVIAQAPRYIVEATAMIFMALLALSLGKNGDFTKAVPVLGGLALGANRLLPAVQQTFVSLVRVQGARASLKRILEGLELTFHPWRDFFVETGLDLTEELVLNSIWFRYNIETDWILRDLNLTIPSKMTVALVGSTGSGKSTTADLILGLLQPQQGQIFIDGKPLDANSVRQWQKKIAYVPQNIFLTDRTIAENIAFGIPFHAIDFSRIEQAANLAQIDNFIKSLPDQYNTCVGERGVRLSGGQRQRIGIARALYGKASLIVFDEATSALDNATEREVMKAIEELSHKVTIVLIAHRISTLECCDCIFELGQGRVIAKGNYKEFIENSVI